MRRALALFLVGGLVSSASAFGMSSEPNDGPAPSAAPAPAPAAATLTLTPAEAAYGCRASDTADPVGAAYNIANPQLINGGQGAAPHGCCVSGSANIDQGGSCCPGYSCSAMVCYDGCCCI